ncbi:type VI secretion system ImpA family N-terminal domain-containing protein, partial [Aliivibrio salmonicida]|uniref:type VI secretion system ImpA family N-terminal domain-containing protein n=1 Tax=Aliivibrio salmonicida TaxID=40269 RepID=UPI003D0CECC3
MCTYKKILSDLSGEEHFGIDLSYETEFESIEKEVVKSTDIFATTKTDWSIVKSKSLNLLEYKSKDYRLLHWLLLSIKKENDHNTFTIMLPTINKFIIKYSTTIYPLREKQLYSTINKIIGTIDDIVKNIIDNSINTDESNNLIALLSILDTTIDKSFNANTDNLYLTIN